MHHTQFFLKHTLVLTLCTLVKMMRFLDNHFDTNSDFIHTYPLVPLIDKFCFTFSYCFCLQGNEITLFHSEFDRSFAGVKQDVSVSLTEVSSLCIHLCIT